jgi:DNA-binding CsgD family transcriptional regulator/tetratricopeptide (TPR) repeat protein
VPTRLRGRDQEFVTLQGWLSRVGTGRGGVALVHGPAGIGKTRLLGEIAAQAAANDGYLVAAARADQLGGMAPLAVLLDAFRASDPPLATSDDLASLAGLADQRFWLLDRLRAALEKRANHHPVLVMLDDLQWADPATLWAVGALATQLTGVPVGWLLARRRAPAGQELTAFLAKMATLQPSMIDLGPLPPEAARQLAGDLLGTELDADVLSLVDRAGGNPFLVTEAVRAASQSSAPSPGGRRTTEWEWAAPPGLTTQPLPEGFALSARTRLADLDPVARQLLEVAAVFGRRFTMREVSVLLDQSVAALVPALRDLIESGVVVGENDHLSFAHDLLWQAVYDDLPSPARRVMHRDAARALLAAGAPPLQVAGHLLVGAGSGDAEAVDLLLRAARDATSTAPGIAADLYAKALALTPDGCERTRTIVEAVPVLAQAGRLDEVRWIADLALSAGVDPESASTIHYTLSVGEALRGSYAEALAEARRGLARYGLPQPARALLGAVEALYLAMTGQVTPAIFSAQTAVHAGEMSGQVVAVTMGLPAEAIAQRLAGRFTTALDRAEQGARRADVESTPARLLEPRRWQGWLLTALDRFDEADAEYLRSRRDMDALGTGVLLHVWHAHRAGLRLAAGRLDEAAAEAEAAVAVAEELGTAALLPTALAILARVALARGDLPQARAYVEQAPRRGDGVYELELDLARGLIFEASGDPVGALRTMEPIWSAFPSHFGVLALMPPAAPHLVRIALRAGDREKAAEAADAGARLAALNPHIASLAGAATHSAGLLGDDPDQLVHAVELYQDSPRPLPRALAYDDAGAALAARGQRAKAVSYLDEALRLFAASGAAGDAARVHGRLRSLGLRRRHPPLPPKPATGWDSLSEPELKVVRLVAAGLTNRAVAERLFLSRHTVDSHLRHIFAKLNINTRVDLTRVALEHGAARPDPDL